MSMWLVLWALTCYHESSLIHTWGQWTSSWYMTNNNAILSNWNCPWMVGIVISTGSFFFLPQGSHPCFSTTGVHAYLFFFVVFFYHRGPYLLFYHRGPYLFFYHRGPYLFFYHRGPYLFSLLVRWLDLLSSQLSLLSHTVYCILVAHGTKHNNQIRNWFENCGTQILV